MLLALSCVVEPAPEGVCELSAKIRKTKQSVALSYDEMV